MKYVFYDESGMITSELTAPNSAVADAQGGDYVEADESASFDTHYVNTATLEVLEKIAGNFSYSISGLTVVFAGVPVGTQITIGNSLLVSDEDGAEIEFDTPGTYEIHIDPPPQYKAETLEVAVG